MAGARRGANSHRRDAGSVQDAGPTGTKVGEGLNPAQALCRRAEVVHGCRIAREDAK
jgi:hypothetical protein